MASGFSCRCVRVHRRGGVRSVALDRWLREDETAMTKRPIDFPVFDADNHMYETEESFTRYLPKQYRNEVQYVDVKGRRKIAVCGVISDYIPNPTFEVIAAPGSHADYFGGNNPEGKTLREITGEPIRCLDAYRSAEPRLPLMDEQGIDATLMFPTLASLLEDRMRHKVDLTHAAIHAFNEWMYDEWTFDYQNRIYATPIITLPIVERAIEELEWCLERGARTVLIRPAAVPGLRGSRSFGLPEFDPFWARVVEAGIFVSMHASDSGYSRHHNEWEGDQEFLPFKPNPFRAAAGSSPIADSMAALICHGALSRFPDLKIASIENGGGWVLPLLHRLSGVYKKMPQEFAEHPVDVFKRNVWVNPFWEEDLGGLIEAMGTDHILFGSDYPHAEGLADPVSFIDDLGEFGDADVAKIMGENLAGLLAA